MFGIRNFTFIGRAGKWGFEFTVGIIEEVTFNATSSAAAHATEIPQNIDVKLISKDRFITSTSTLVISKMAQTKLIDVIAGATTNLLV